MTEQQQTAPTPLPCPFCGGAKVSVEEGTTYRWEYATCDECGAQSGEVRRQYPQSAKDPEVIAAAIAEWNTRDRREIDRITAERDEARAELNAWRTMFPVNTPFEVAAKLMRGG